MFIDHNERVRKREAVKATHNLRRAETLCGLRAKLDQKKRHAEKIQMKKALKGQEERDVTSAGPQEPSSTPLHQYLLDRSQASNARALSSAIKNKRAEKVAKFPVHMPKVKGIGEEEMFKVVKTRKKTAKKDWKRMLTRPTFVGPDFTRRPVKYETFIRPMGLRYKKANVTHPELAVTVLLLIISVKKNPQNPIYMQLEVLTKAPIIEVNVSELDLVITGGNVIWGKWVQITNNCERWLHECGASSVSVRHHTQVPQAPSIIHADHGTITFSSSSELTARLNTGAGILKGLIAIRMGPLPLLASSD